jgi:beta-lactamase class A
MSGVKIWKPAENRAVFVPALFLASLAIGSPAAPAKKISPAFGSLKRQMDAISSDFHGKLGYCLISLKNGESIGRMEDEAFPSASTIKTCILYELVKQIEERKLSWTEKVTLPPIDQRSQSMWTAYLQPSVKVNLEGLANLMMNVSDNTAAVALADRVGVENIEKRLLGLGMKNTACTIHVPATNSRLAGLRAKFQNMGVASPKEMALFLKGLYDGKLASRAASERILRIMSHEYWDDFFASQIPPGIYVCSKVGALNRSRSDIAIVYGAHPYILTVYTDDDKDQSWGDNCEPHVALRKISSLVWNALNPRQKYKAPADAAKWYPSGGGVEDS